jgi:phage terminase large subunit-like protein
MSKIPGLERSQIESELARRRADDPLLVWIPHDKQSAFINEVMGKPGGETWFAAANRCITPWSPLEMGSSTRLPAELIGEKGFDVRSWDGGSQCTKKASPLFLKGIEPAFRFHLDNGEAFEATRRHRVLTPSGWISLGSIMTTQDDRHYLGIDEGLMANCGKANRRYDQQPQTAINTDRAILPQEADVRKQDLLRHVHVDVTVPTPARIHACLESFPLSTPDDPDLLSALFSLWTTNSVYTSDQQRSYPLPNAVIQQGASNPVQEVELCREILNQSDDDHAYYCLPFAIPLSGNVKLIGYQNIGMRPIIDFTVESTHCYMASGVVHHNSGKTNAGAYCGSGLARFGNQLARWQNLGDGIQVRDTATMGLVVSLDYPNSRDVVQPYYFDNGYKRHDLKSFIPDREIKHWDKQANILRLKNGSIIGFKSAETGAAKAQGREAEWVHFDEVPPKDYYDETTIRIGAKPLKIFGTCTILPPPGQAGGVSWLFSEIIRPWQEGILKHVKVFGASIYDNPHVNQEEITRLESRFPPETNEGRIRLGGEYLPGIGGARAYPNFDRAIHVAAQGPLLPYQPICWAWDFNVVPLISLVGQRDGNMFRFHREMTMEPGNIPEMCEQFMENHATHKGEIWVYGDASGGNRSAQTAGSDYKLILTTMRRYSRPVKLKVPLANPGVIDRLNSVNHNLKDSQGIIQVQIDPSCKELIADLEMVMRDPRTNSIKKSSDPKDPYSRRTHASDGAGYWIHKESPVKDTAPQPLNRSQMTNKNPGYSFGRSDRTRSPGVRRNR